jgi:hypothetical protein
MNRKRVDHAVSEILGTALLLGMAISLFSILNVMVFSYPVTPSPPAVNLVGTIVGDNVTLLHSGGEALDLDTKILVTINDTTVDFTVNSSLPNESKGDGWTIGEIVVYYHNETILDEHRVSVIVVDVKSNSVVMSSDLQKGTS